VEVEQRNDGWCGDCGEWSDISGISAGIARRYGKVTMLGVESVPHGICEEAHWEVSHSLEDTDVVLLRIVYFESPGRSE
jgi:hypothetical protein